MVSMHARTVSMHARMASMHTCMACTGGAVPGGESVETSQSSLSRNKRIQALQVAMA